MYLLSKIVQSLMTVSKILDKIDQVESSSKSDRAFISGRRLNFKTLTLILKVLATVLTDIGTARFRGQVSTDLFR